jgi:small conductance mechanosensitive channel
LILIVVIGLQLILRTLIAAVVKQVVHGHHTGTVVDAKKREKTLVGMFRTTAGVVLWTVGVVMILGTLVNIATLMTGAGLIGVVFGLGAQSIIRDFLAGFFVIVENQYRVGDLITVRAIATEITGVVDDLTVRITRIRDLDGNLHTIPNGVVISVTNLSFGYANANLDIDVAYGADIDRVERVINAVGDMLAQEEEWKKQIIEPIHFLRVEKFGEKQITVRALGKVAPGAQWVVAGEYRRRIIGEFKQKGIPVSEDAISKESKRPKK